MNCKKFNLHNTCELIELEDGSTTWIRVSKHVYDRIDFERGKNQLMQATGVEIRFVINSGEAKLKIKSLSPKEKMTQFHIYYGSIQGGWDGHEINKFITNEPCEFVISRPNNMDLLKQVSKENNFPFDPEVIRIIFERGQYAILGIEGDISLPSPSQLPQEVLLTYGSSITHGSNALNASNTWTSLLSHHLKMDLVNLGMAGACRLEPAMIDYIANAQWDKAILELGINVLDWEESKIREHVNYAIETIASKNQNKPIYVISPFYCSDDYKEIGNAAKWRNIIEETVISHNYPNVTYINGLDILGDMSLISADEVHPNIYGVQQIFEKLYQIIK